MLRLTLILALVLGLVGCGESDDRTRIRVWHQKTGAERTLFEQQIARYNASQDTVVVDVLYRETEEMRNLFVIASVGGQGPEIIYGPADNVGVLAVTGTVRPITDILPHDHLDALVEDGLVGWDGPPQLVADQLGNHLVFIYNRRFFDRAPETTEEWVAAMRRISGDPQPGRRPDVYGIAWNYREPFFFIPFLTGFGGWVMDDDGTPTLDRPETVNAIRFVLDLRDRYRVIPAESDYDTAETLFKEGRAASIINGPWAFAEYERAGIDFGIAPIPRVSETGLWSAPMVAAKGYSVNANLPDRMIPAVRDLLVYLTGEAVQREMAEQLATIPTWRTLAEQDLGNPLLAASQAAADLGRPMPVAPQMRQVWDGMRGPYQLVMNGAVSPEEGARRMQAEVEKRIADTFL